MDVMTARHLYCTKDAARNKESEYLNGAPIVLAVTGGRPRTVLLDTGSSISLIQPGVCTSEITRASVTPFEVTGDELRVKGEQRVIIIINGETYNHEFCVCDLATEADVIVGRDFLKKMEATLDFEKGTLWLKRTGKVDHDPLRRGRCESRRTAARAAIRVFSREDGCGRQESCRIRRKKQNERHADALSRAVQAVAHDFGFPGNVVKTAQEADKFCQSLRSSSGPASSKSEYFKHEK